METPEAWTVWHLVGAVVLVVVGAIVGSWAAGVTGDLLERSKLDPMVRSMLVRWVRPVIVLVAIIAALDLLDVDLTGALVLLAGAALAVALALHPTLAHLIGGGVLVTLRPYREGERVTCAGLEGRIVEQGSLAVVLEQDDGTLATIPNGVVLAGPILNHVRTGRRRIEVVVDLPVGADPAALRAEIEQLLGREPRVLPTPTPELLVTMGREGTTLATRVWADAPSHDALRSALAEAIHALVKVHVAERVAGRR
jgi:small conductance mechanosensitive channel